MGDGFRGTRSGEVVGEHSHEAFVWGARWVTATWAPRMEVGSCGEFGDGGTMVVGEFDRVRRPEFLTAVVAWCGGQRDHRIRWYKNQAPA